MYRVSRQLREMAVAVAEWLVSIVCAEPLPEVLGELTTSGLRLRNEMEEGPGVDRSSWKIPTAIRSSSSSPSVAYEPATGSRTSATTSSGIARVTPPIHIGVR